MKFWNLAVSKDKSGAKAIDITVYGEIEGFWGDGVYSQEIAAQLAAHKDAKSITQRINSRGGDVFGGIAIFNAVNGHGAPVTSIVEGLAGSAASLIAMAGKTVMKPGAMLMAHNPWAVARGNAEDLRQTADVLDQVRDSLVSIYQRKTGKSAGELKAILDAETWFTAEQAKAEGFADEVEGEAVKARASADQVFFGGVGFQRGQLESRILALAAEEPPEASPEAPEAASAPASPEAPEVEPEAEPAAEPAAPEAPAEPEPEAPAPEEASASARRLFTDGELRALGEVRAAAIAKQFDDLLALASAPITRARIQAEAPEVLAELRDEVRAEERVACAAEVATAERDRIQAIDELEVAAEFPELVRAAKYGDKPGTAAELAVAVVKAQKDRGHSILAQRRAESGGAASVAAGTPDRERDATTREREAASDIAARANARR